MRNAVFFKFIEELGISQAAIISNHCKWKNALIEKMLTDIIREKGDDNKNNNVKSYGRRDEFSWPVLHGTFSLNFYITVEEKGKS